LLAVTLLLSITLLLAITLKQIPLLDTAGRMAAVKLWRREEADRLEAEHLHRLRQDGADYPGPAGDPNVTAPMASWRALNRSIGGPPPYWVHLDTAGEPGNIDREY
jgi:hypothetical protein